MPGTITYPYLRDKVCELRNVVYEDLKVSEQKRLAAWITKAYRYAYGDWLWDEALTTGEFAVVDGKVTGLVASDFSRIECWTHDPRPVTTTGVKVDVYAVDSEGVWIHSTADSVWIRYQPRAPVFTFESTETSLLLWVLEEVTACLALSYWWTAEQEHDQAARLKAEAEDLLNKLTVIGPR